MSWMLTAIWHILPKDHAVRTHKFKYHSTLFGIDSWNHPTIAQDDALMDGHNHVYMCENCDIYCAIGLAMNVRSGRNEHWFEMCDQKEFDLHISRAQGVVLEENIRTCGQEIMLKALK